MMTKFQNYTVPKRFRTLLSPTVFATEANLTFSLNAKQALIIANNLTNVRTNLCERHPHALDAPPVIFAFHNRQGGCAYFRCVINPALHFFPSIVIHPFHMS